MNYYEHHLGDYARDTTHLTVLEHGVYRLLLDRYYTREEGIPEAQAYRVALARSEDERAAVDVILDEFFALKDGLWINNKAEEEISKARARIDAASTNGKRGGRPRKNPDESETKAKITQPFQSGYENKTQTKAHQTPITNHHTPEEEKTRSRFDLLWNEFPPCPNNPRLKALEEWMSLDLSDDEVESAIAGAGAYARWLREPAQKGCPVCHTHRWLKERRWEGFAANRLGTIDPELKRIGEIESLARVKRMNEAANV